MIFFIVNSNSNMNTTSALVLFGTGIMLYSYQKWVTRVYFSYEHGVDYYGGDRNCYKGGMGPAVESHRVVCASDPTCKGFTVRTPYPDTVHCSKKHMGTRTLNIDRGFYMKKQESGKDIAMRALQLFT